MDYRTSLTCLLLLWIPSRDRTISRVTSTLHGYQSVFFEKIGPWTSKDLKLSPAQKTVMSPAWRCQCCPFEVEFRLAGSHILQKNGLPFFWFPVWSRQHPLLDSYPSILRGQDSIEMTSSLIIIRTGAARIRLYYPRRSMNRMPQLPHIIDSWWVRSSRDPISAEAIHLQVVRGVVCSLSIIRSSRN